MIEWPRLKSGRHEVGHVGEQCAGEAGIDRREGEGLDLDAGDAHRGGAGRDFVVAHGDHGEADVGIADTPGAPGGESQHDPDDIVVAVIGGERPAGPSERRDAGDAVGAAHHRLPVGGDDDEGHVEAQRRQSKVVALQAQHRQADHDGYECSADDGRRNRQPGRKAERRRQDRRDVGAAADEARLGEGDEAGIAEGEVEANDGDGRDQRQVEDADAVAADESGQHERQQEERTGGEEGATLRHARWPMRSPKMPCGRTSRNRIITRKTNPSL